MNKGSDYKPNPTTTHRLQSRGLVFGAANPGFIISSKHGDKVSHGIIIREGGRDCQKNGNTVYLNVLLWLILFHFRRSPALSVSFSKCRGSRSICILLSVTLAPADIAERNQGKLVS